MKNSGVGLREKAYSYFFYNQISKKVGVCLFDSPWLINNSLYQYFQNAYIKKIISCYKQTPNLVVIENTSLCNSHCLMCPHDIMKRKKGIMLEKLYRKIIDECAQLGVRNIGLHNFGEPLIDKDFAQRVKYAKDRGIDQVGTSTNGALLTSALSEKIINSGLDTINFSLDAYSQKAYEMIRVGLPYKKVMDNVMDFVEIRNKMESNKPLIIVDFIETDFNKGETEKFIEKWKNVADKVNITTLHSWGGSFKDKAGKGTLHSSRSSLRREPCRFLWTDMVINWDGRVSACCQDYEAKMIVGNIATTSLKEIWQGEVLNKLREKHLSGKVSDIPLCSQCDYRSVWWLFK